MRLRHSIVGLFLLFTSNTIAQIVDSTKIQVSFQSKYWANVRDSSISFIQLKPYNRYEHLEINSFDKNLKRKIITEVDLDKKYKFQEQWSNHHSIYLLLSQSNLKKHLLVQYSYTCLLYTSPSPRDA